jgi:hypothetical protein
VDPFHYVATFGATLLLCDAQPTDSSRNHGHHISTAVAVIGREPNAEFVELGFSQGSDKRSSVIAPSHARALHLSELLPIGTSSDE